MSSQKNYPYMFTHPWHIMNTRHCSGFFSLFCIVKTQRNSTQLNPTLKQLALELDIVVKCSTTPPTPPHPIPTHPTTTNFSATSRPAIELKFGTHTHQTNLTTTQHNFNPTNYWGGGSQTLPPGLTLTNLFGTKTLLRQLSTIQHNINPTIFQRGGGHKPFPQG